MRRRQYDVISVSSTNFVLILKVQSTFFLLIMCLKIFYEKVMK